VSAQPSAQRAPRASARAAAAPLFALVAPLFLLGGCGSPGEPALSNLRFDGQAKDSPLVLLLSVDFRDDDANLAGGVLETFINQRPTSAGPLPLRPIFLSSDVDERATSGTLKFVLELAFADEPPPSGTAFTLGARVSDDDANASATQEIRLKLEAGSQGG
jgi:hypothetical protein